MELLEREDELRALGARPHGVVLVAGEAGIGKTSLVREFCAGSGRPVLWGACDALRTPSPLGPLRDMARTAGGELARVLAAEGPRHALFSAFLDQVGAGEAVAVVEDPHWADEATLDLLMFAGRRMAGTGGLLLVTYRDDEVGPGHPLLAVLGALATDRAVRRLRLPPLSAAAVAALAGPSGPDATRLHGRTGGNPFFVTESLADPGQPVPATVRDAVLARAARLDAAGREALEAVAVFPGHALLAMVEAEPAAVDACAAAGVLVVEGARLRFRHELARLAVEEGIAPARRALLHARALAGLSEHGADPARLAYHAEEAGDGAAVLRYAPAAAEAAVAVSAHRQAADHLERALRFASPGAERAELLERYAEVCARLDRSDAAVEASGLALAHWRAVDERERAASLMAQRSQYLWFSGETSAAHESVRAALDLAGTLPPGPALATATTWSAFLLMLARAVPEAIETGAEAIALAERFGGPALLVRALNAVGTAEWFHDPVLAEEHLTRGLELARRHGRDADAGAVMLNLGSGAGEIRRYADAERWLLRTAAWCAERDLDGHRRYAGAWLARCLFERGEWDRAESLLAEEEVPESPPARIVTLTVLGRIRARRGEPGAAEALDEAWELAVRTGDLQRLWPAAAGRAELARLNGRPSGDLAAETYGLALRLRHGWAIGELGRLLDERPDPVPETAAPPYREAPAAEAWAWAEIGCPYEEATALAEDDDRLGEALRLFERLGARPAADLVLARMRALGRRRPRRSTLAHPRGLTARESDVLALLAEGLRNAEIAERLHISEKTAGHHVSAILAKLGAATRRDAARIALDGGLL
ncbi:ATP-binding protein [Actinocorallia longicatena]|uniref:AAA family ATPase n=1 Tax=Actinocorallia longicatena TaxID=111803 RepID=A0ABP6QRG4_9ACTN